jgi:hypothetical protein
MAPNFDGEFLKSAQLLARGRKLLRSSITHPVVVVASLPAWAPPLVPALLAASAAAAAAAVCAEVGGISSRIARARVPLCPPLRLPGCW